MKKNGSVSGHFMMVSRFSAVTMVPVRRHGERLEGRRAAARAVRQAIYERHHISLPLGMITIRSAPRKPPRACLGLRYRYLSVRAPVAVSFSHAGGYAAAVATTTFRRIGIDIEPIRALPPLVVERFLNSEEHACVAELEAHKRRERIMQYWTVKEAYLKMRGCGLGRHPSAITVRHEHGGNCIRIHDPLHDDRVHVVSRIVRSLGGKPLACTIVAAV